MTQQHPSDPGGTFARPLLALLAALTVLPLGACGDDPFQLDWPARPDTVLLFSLARPELNLPAGFNFNRRRTVIVEAPAATGSWDIAVDTQDGELLFLPPGVLNIQSRARITALPGLSFDDVEEAPADTTVYVAEEGLAVELNTVYVVRTGQDFDQLGRRCVFFAKLEPLEVDPASGTVRFLYDANPTCNDPRLVPPD